MSRIKFVKEKGNEKKKMLIGIMIAAAIIISGISLFTMPTKGNGNSSPPIVVIGYVHYQNGSVANHTFVNITDVINGSYATNYTQANGSYQVFFNFPNASVISVGDKLVGIANDSAGLYGTNDTLAIPHNGRVWLNITLGTPVTNKTLVGMKCQNGLYITLNTTFNLSAWDPNGDGINATYFRIWHNGQWYPAPGSGDQYSKGSNFTKYTGNFTIWSLNQTLGVPAEEGVYYLEYYSVDDNTTIQGVEYTHNQTHIVDETIPTSSYAYGEPKVWVGQPNLEAIIGPNTPFWINATDSISGVSKIEYAVWRNMTHPGDWHLLYNDTIYYNDSNGENRTVSLPLYFDEGCYYEVTWNVTDCVGHVSKDYTAEFAVDVKPPSINWAVGKPNYTDDNENLWINCSTPIWINITDNGCGGIKAGVNRTVIDVFWNETQGTYFSHHRTIVVYDGSPDDENGVYGEISYKLTLPEQCFHEVRVVAYDYVDNHAGDKRQFFVDCQPPWINKTIPKIAFLVQDKNESSISISEGSNDYWQEFIANWSYVDAVNVSICGDSLLHNISAEIYSDDNGQPGELIATTENYTGSYCGWLQLHFKNRTYLEHGAHYWLRLYSPYTSFYWNGTNASTNPWVGNSIVNGNINTTWDFAFKLEYYPVFFNTTTPYPVHPEYSFANDSHQYDHNGLNNTWVTSKAFFHIAYGDEGCMGGVGIESVKYRIWHNGWSSWKNYTGPFNLPDECKYYIEINATDHLGQSTILNQTHYVDNSPPTDVVDIPDVHGYYQYNDKQYMRAGKGIWINLTDQPECNPVGLREATFYWRYTYYNFTTPTQEEHPANFTDYHDGFTHIVEKDGMLWYVVHLNMSNYSVFLSFNRECMHDIYYFYNATDWLDNNVTSPVKHIKLYVDANPPEITGMTVWGHYYYNETNPHPANETIVINDSAGHIRAGANFTLYAKDTPNPIPMMCIAQMEGSQRDSLQPYPQPWPWDAQSFVAQCHHINVTKLYLNWTGEANVTVYIHNESGTILGSATTHLTGTGEGWVTFVFNPGVDTIIGHTYYLEAHSEGNRSIDWFYSQDNPYPGGFATVSGTPHASPSNGSWDWKFQIISDEENPCASGAEGIYYGYYYKGEWYPNETGAGVINISKYYNDTEIDNAFMGHYLWYVINDSSPLDHDSRHGYIAGNVSFNEECEHDFYYWTKDNVCHHSEVYHHVFYVDATPPEVNMEMPSCYNVEGNVVEKTIWHDSFENGIATGWTIAPLNGSDEWLVENESYIENMSWGDSAIMDGKYALVYDDDAWDSGLSAHNASYAVTPPIDCMAYDKVYLSFNVYNEIYETNSGIWVNISNDGGITWQNVWYIDENYSGNVVLDISSLAARHTILINFTYDDRTDWSYGVIIDNITVYYPREHISCNVPIYLHAFDYPITSGLVVDQEQTTGIAWDAVETTMKNSTTGELCTAQSFIPTVDRLDAVELWLDISNVPVTVNVSIYDSGLNLINYSTATFIDSGSGWIPFTFPSVPLTPGETYWIAVNASGSGVVWLWNDQSNAYPAGIMHRCGDSVPDKNHDFAFKTEYYSDKAPAECAAGVEGIYYGYYYKGEWYPNAPGNGVVNITQYYTQDEIDSSFGGHALWYVYDPYKGIVFANECKHDLYYWAKDNVCHHTLVYHRTLYVDNSEPEVNLQNPSTCYEKIGNIQYIQTGNNITLTANDMPSSNCSSGTWLYWRYVWNGGYYPDDFYYFNGFETWTTMQGWNQTNEASHGGDYSAVSNSSLIGWYWLNISNINLPSVSGNNKIFLIFWQKADDLSNYDASNMFGVWNASGFTPLKFFYKEDMSNEWQRVIIDLTPFAGQTITLSWVYENDYGLGEKWYIDDVEIAVWNATFGYSGVIQNISFNDDCVHTLYYFASDTTCHYSEIYNQTYHVDGTAPETGFSMATNCTEGPIWNESGEYWQACDWANITFNVNNIGTSPCIDPNTFTYVRYEKWNETKHGWDYYPDGTGELINGHYWYNITDTLYLNLTGGCNYTVYYFSKDGVCNVEDVKSMNIHIDDMPPVTTPYFPNFNCGDVPVINGIYFINRYTLIGLNATDYPIGCASGVETTYYKVWKYNPEDGEFDIPLTDDWEVYTPYIDLNSLVTHYNSQHGTYYTVCGAYEMWFYSKDNCCHTEDMNRIDIIVDCNPPTTEKNFAGLYVKKNIENVNATWIGRHTIIWFNASDGETGMRSGVKTIYWEIVNDTLDVLNSSTNPDINAKDYHISISVNDLINKYGLTDGRYDLFHWAVDRVCNQETTDHKQWIVIDITPPNSTIEQEPNCYHDSVPFNITVTNIHDNGYNGGVGVCKVSLYYRYSWDNATWGNWILYETNSTLVTNPDGSIADWTLSFTPPAGERNGYFQFKSIAYDCLGNEEMKTGPDAWCKVIVDHEAPVVTKEYGEPNVYTDLGGGEMGHVITSHTMIYINATDLPDEANASGIEKIYWSFDGVTWYNTTDYNGAYTANYSFTPSDLGLSEGFYQIFVEAKDMLGHVSKQLKQKFVIDDTAPESMANATCEGTTIFVTANATDNAAGVEKVELFGSYSTDNSTWGNWVSYGYGVYNATTGKWEWKLENMSEGYYRFYTIATDKVGNVEAAPITPDVTCHIKHYPDWDVNQDGKVNVLDMIMIAHHWMETGTPGWIREDVNKDGVVNVLDLIIVGHHFGEIYDP